MGESFWPAGELPREPHTSSVCRRGMSSARSGAPPLPPPLLWLLLMRDVEEASGEPPPEVAGRLPLTSCSLARPCTAIMRQEEGRLEEHWWTREVEVERPNRRLEGGGGGIGKGNLCGMDEKERRGVSGDRAQGTKQGRKVGEKAGKEGVGAGVKWRVGGRGVAHAGKRRAGL